MGIFQKLWDTKTQYPKISVMFCGFLGAVTHRQCPQITEKNYSLGSDQNESFKVRLLLSECSFDSIIRLKGVSQAMLSWEPCVQLCNTRIYA